MQFTDKSPIFGASVYCENRLLGKTNELGILSFNTKCQKLDIIADNFESEEAEVKKTMEVFLKPSTEKTRNIENITIKDQSDPRALKILNEVNQRFKENNPQSLDSYTFKSYSKTSLDIDKDSINAYKEFMAKRSDSLSHTASRNFKQSEKRKKDSLDGEGFFKTVESSQFFLWEKVQQYQFSKKYGEKVTVLDNKISGFQNPIYEILAFRSNLNKIPKQIRRENRNLHRFFLADTILVDGRKTFVIKFRELEKMQIANARKYTGSIFIDCDSYAIKKIESISKKSNEGSIVSEWKLIGNKWFLTREKIKLKLGDSSFYLEEKKKNREDKEKKKRKKKTFGNYLYVKNLFSNFEINPKQSSEDFKGYTFSVKNTDGKLLQNYRKDTLDERERNTYVKIDSLGAKYKIEKKIYFASNLLKGNLRFGMVDFNITKFVNYSKYESFRLGLGAKMNEKFSHIFSPDAYFGYGFGDHKWKFGTGIDFNFSKIRNSIFRIEYIDDYSAIGKFSTYFWNNSKKIQGFGDDFHNKNFFHYKGYGASLEYDISNSISAKISVNKQRQEAKFDYNYLNFNNYFENFSTAISLKLAPNDKNMMTPTGKFTYEKNYPQFFLNIEKGLNIFGANIDYQRINVLAEHLFTTKAGTTNLKFFGGVISGTAPIWKDFQLVGLTDAYSSTFLSKFSLPSTLGFATMPSGIFYTDKFIQLQVSHRLPFVIKNFGKRFSNINLRYNSAIGNFKNPEDHQFNFQVLDHYYQEAGFLLSNFLGSKYGIGFFYKVGYYQSSNFTDNLGIQIKF